MRHLTTNTRSCAGSTRASMSNTRECDSRDELGVTMSNNFHVTRVGKNHETAKQVRYEMAGMWGREAGTNESRIVISRQ